MKFNREKLSAEQEPSELYQAEVIVVPGHSIERVDVKGEEKWKPTRLIQEVDDKGWRTAERNLDLDKDGENAIVGGCNAVTLAAAQYYEDLVKKGVPPKLVIFAAGRAAALDKHAADNPSLSEAGPMMEVFERETNASENLGNENIKILDKTKTTQDDVENSIELAHAEGLTKVAFLLLDLRLDRAEAFWEAMKEKKPELVSMEVKFLAAEDFLRERYKDQPEMIEKILSEFTASEAYHKTNQAEIGGAEAVRSGKYKGKGQY